MKKIILPLLEFLIYTIVSYLFFSFLNNWNYFHNWNFISKFLHVVITSCGINIILRYYFLKQNK